MVLAEVHDIVLIKINSCFIGGDTVPPMAAIQIPVTAYEALHDLEEHPEDKPFSHIWSSAKVSGEQGNRRLVADWPGYTMRTECEVRSVTQQVGPGSAEWRESGERV